MSSPHVREWDNFVCSSDQHYPFYHPQAQELLKAFVKIYRPKHFWLAGDIFDCATISRFIDIRPKFHDWAEERKNALVGFDDLNAALDAAKVTHRHMGPGNHESRLPTYMFLHANKMAGLEELSIPAQFGLHKKGWKYYDSTCREGFTHQWLKHLTIAHGWMTGIHPAAAYLRKFPGMSFIVGHNHRADHKRHGAPYADAECFVNGCMSLDASYIPISNETRGFTAGRVNFKTGQFAIFQVNIVEGDNGEVRLFSEICQLICRPDLKNRGRWKVENLSI